MKSGKTRRIRLGLLPRVIIAIVLGVLLGEFLPMSLVRVSATFNGIFSQFLGFMIPLIIIGLVTPAIADIGRGAGRMLVVTVLIAYADTVISGVLAFATGSALFPSMVSGAPASVDTVAKAHDILPYFSVNIPAMVDVMSALVFSFLAGLAIAYSRMPVLKGAFAEFRVVIEKTIGAVIIPFLPFYIFGIFLSMTVNGDAYRIMTVFAKIICVIFALHIIILLYQFCIAGAVSRRNPLRLLVTMLPAYFTALGTSSSAATIPVTLQQASRCGVSDEIGGFVVPLCATIHMSGSTMKITACALTIMLLEGMPFSFGMFLHFILMLAVVMVAAPGVPGGAVMAALAPLGSILGFGPSEQALMIALYIAMDSFGTACNVTGDGAIAVVVDKYFRWREAR